MPSTFSDVGFYMFKMAFFFICRGIVYLFIYDSNLYELTMTIVRLGGQFYTIFYINYAGRIAVAVVSSCNIISFRRCFARKRRDFTVPIDTFINSAISTNEYCFT